jgi:ribosomal protein S1
MKSSKFFGSANFASSSVNNANVTTAHDDFDWDDVDGQKAYANNPMHELLKYAQLPIKHPELRDLLTGTIVGKGRKEYFVSIAGVASDAMLSFSETDGELSNGDTVQLFVNGLVLKSDEPMVVSQKKATVWLDLQHAQEEGATVQVHVNGLVKAGSRIQGLKVTYNGMEGFIPRSHFSRETAVASELGDTMSVKILKANPKGSYGGSLVMSDRLVANEGSDAVLAKLEVGAIVEGVVKKFVTEKEGSREIGALIAIADGAFTAFVHSTEIAENRRPSATLSLDQVIDVEIISINKAKREVKVSYRSAQIAKMTDGLVVNEIIPAEILRFKEQVGFFVSIGNGFTALLPCSQVTDGRDVNVRPFFQVGQTINVLLTELNKSKNRAIVSFKQAALRTLVEGQKYNGTVNKILPQVGLYVVCDGIGGLLHFSELAKGERISSFKEGDAIEVTLKRVSESNNRTLVAWARRARN